MDNYLSILLVLIIYALHFTNTLYSDRDRIMKNNDILIEESSGNVFADLGYANAEEALLKSNLAQAIVEVIEQQKLSEVDVFTRLGINSLILSKLKRGQLRELKTGELFRFLNLLNQDVEIIIRNRSEESSAKTLTIMSV